MPKNVNRCRHRLSTMSASTKTADTAVTPHPVPARDTADITSVSHAVRRWANARSTNASNSVDDPADARSS